MNFINDRYDRHDRYDRYERYDRYGKGIENEYIKDISIFTGPPVSGPQGNTCCAICGRSLYSCHCHLEKTFNYYY